MVLDLDKQSVGVSHGADRDLAGSTVNREVGVA